jgi:hypothetical protein
MRVAAAVLLVGCLLAVPTTAGAQAPLPVGEAEGVRIVRERGALVVVFTPSAKKLWRRVAGRRVSVLCTEFLPDGSAGGGTTMRAPKRGRKIRTGDLTRGMDYCSVSLEPRRGSQRSSEWLVSVPLTQRGAVYLDEREKTSEMMGILILAGVLAEKRGLQGAATAEQLLARWPHLAGYLVALSGPAETPPPKTIGYWSDAVQHVAVAALSSSGRRLFVEYEGDVLHTSVAGYIYGDPE